MFHLAIDTEPFRRENLYFGSERFRRLVELVERGDVTVIVTDIVVGEVKRALGERTRDAIELLKQSSVRRVLGPLAQVQTAGLVGSVKKHDEASLVVQLHAKFDDLLNKLQAEIVSSDGISVAEVRNRYFGAIPPFGTRSDKKHEFPDALTVLALQDFAVLRSITVHVVGADKGLAEAVAAAANLVHVETIPEAISLVLTHVERTKKLAEAAERVAEVLDDDIVTAIAAEFEESAFYVDDENGDVSEVSVLGTTISAFYVAEIQGDEVTLEFIAEIEYTADVTFEDPDRTAYDSETGETIVFGYVEERVRQSKRVEGGVKIALRLDDLESSTIDNVWLDQSEFGIRVGL